MFSLVIAAPEPIRAQFRGQKLAAMLNHSPQTAARLRVHSGWDFETTSTVVQYRRRAAHPGPSRARDVAAGT
jgi:hypothetical protein